MFAPHVVRLSLIGQISLPETGVTAYAIFPHSGPDHGASHWQPDARQTPFKLQSRSFSHGIGGTGGDGGGGLPLQPLWRQPQMLPAVSGFFTSLASAARLQAELLAWNDHATPLLPLSFAQAAQQAVEVFARLHE